MSQVIANSSEVAAEGGPRELKGQRAPQGRVVRLNTFQILMRRWAKLHPYNAGQVMRVTGPADRERWKRAVEAVVDELGMGKATFAEGELTVRIVPVKEVEVEEWDKGMEAYFNQELNRPFLPETLPLRFCLLPAEEEGSHYFAAVYDHWIADSRGMRELMHRILERYQYPEGKAGGYLPALTLDAPPFRKVFRKYFGRFPQVRAVVESLKNIWQHRSAYRLNIPRPLDFTARFIYREIPDGVIEGMHAFAKKRGGSVNDLFIAIIAQAMGEYTAPDRLGRKKKPMHYERRDLGIGTIVDIRAASNQPLDGVFGLYLSSYSTMLKVPEKRPAEDVLREVTAKTRKWKRPGATVKSFCGLGMARFWYDIYDSPRFRATLLHKTVSVVAGISNVNMTGSWADAKSAEAVAHGGEVPRIVDYLRISPTGPLIPVVFTLTTIGDRLSLCVTYRTTAFYESRLLTVVDDFIKRVIAVADAGHREAGRAGT